MMYETIKRLAKENGLRVKDLLALANQNDPFYVGTPTTKEMADWFTDLWDRFGYGTGVHLRRVHYQLVSQDNPVKADGTPYENTVNNWQYLCNAGKYARYLGLVDIEAFTDRRNPEPYLYAQYAEYTNRQPGWSFDVPLWNLPSLPTDIDLPLPEPYVTGYDYDLSDQPYHLEVWCEKSTMNDVLRPVCARYGSNFITGLGEMSITAVNDLVERVRSSDKPTRIFYVSDYDPAGYGMPTSVARKIEFMLTGDDSIDLKLAPVVLTHDQVREYGLPRTPIKESERRKDSFEQIHGEGAVELDALEALHPGELSSIVAQELEPYRDHELDSRLSDADEDATEIVQHEFQTAMEPYLEELQEIREGVRSVLARHSSLNDEIEQYRERVRSVRDKMESTDIHIELPDRPSANVDGDSGGLWLYDSERNYVQQLRVYHQHKQGMMDEEAV